MEPISRPGRKARARPEVLYNRSELPIGGLAQSPTLGGLRSPVRVAHTLVCMCAPAGVATANGDVGATRVSQET